MYLFGRNLQSWEHMKPYNVHTYITKLSEFSAPYRLISILPNSKMPRSFTNPLLAAPSLYPTPKLKIEKYNILNIPQIYHNWWFHMQWLHNNQTNDDILTSIFIYNHHHLNQHFKNLNHLSTPNKGDNILHYVITLIPQQIVSYAIFAQDTNKWQYTHIHILIQSSTCMLEY